MSIVFIPGVGFRPSTSAMLVSPVSAERGEWSVTIERLVSGPDKAELGFSLTGSGGPPISGREFVRPEPPEWTSLPISLRHAGGTIELTNEGRRGRGGFTTGAGTHLRTIQSTVTFAPLPAGTTALEVVFDGAPGNWAVPVTLTPSTEFGAPATRLEASETHHGVTLTARAISRTDTTTAVDVYASLEPRPHPRFMRSLGVARYRGIGGYEPQFSLADESGQELREFAVFDDEVASGAELHQVLVFPALPPSVSGGVLTIGDVVLAESIGEWTTLPVPFEGPVRFGPFDVQASISKVQSRRGPAVRVVLDDGGWRDDRRLLYPETVRVNDHYSGIGWEGAPTPGEPCGVNAEDPHGAATEVKLESPVVRLRGPWRLTVDAGSGRA